MVQSPDASSFTLLSNPTAFLGGGRCLINSHQLSENEIVMEARVQPPSQVNTFVIRHKTPQPRMHKYKCSVDQAWAQKVSQRDDEGRGPCHFPMKGLGHLSTKRRHGLWQMRDSLLERPHRQKPGTRGFRKIIQTAHENGEKKNSLRSKRPLGVGHGNFCTPLGQGASLGHSGVPTTDALRDAQESIPPTQGVCTC